MKKTRRSKKWLLNLLITLIFLGGIAVMCYPYFSNWYNQRFQESLITEYDHTVKELSEEEKQAELDACNEYNRKLIGNAVLTDPFDPDAERIATEEYEARLNINGNGIMGYIEIPEINVKLTIGHGTSAEVLDEGAGHLENTSLPVGGTATHAVLSAHTAYAKAELFNDLIELVEGDVFYLTILDDKLAYQVDQIKVVEPTDTSDLTIDSSGDYVTLITCTPYGVNSHRLLVRGYRIPYVEEEVQTPEGRDYTMYIIAAIIVLIILIILIIFAVIRRRRKKSKEVDDDNNLREKRGKE
ncbi:MAG: class C sortase [Lachnospiraceae bacterium]